MTPIEFKKMRTYLGLSQKDLAPMIGVTFKTVSDYETGKVSIPGPIPILVKYLFPDYFTKKNEKKDLPALVSDHLIPLREFKNNLRALQVQTHQRELKKIRADDVKFIDLFAGIGGIRKAFESNGAKCVFSSEIDLFAQYTYFANHGTVPFGDITKIQPEDIPEFDILCAGFPCQPFSHIGKREGFKHPTQGTMFYEIVRLLRGVQKKPTAIFLENVPGILNHDNGHTLKTILDSLKELGYSCSYCVLNAKDFGVPQNRARFYLVGLLGTETFVFPDAPNEYSNIGDYLQTGVEGYSISKHLQKSYLFKCDDGRPSLIDKSTKGAVKTLCSSYHKIQRLTGTFVKDGETGIRLLTTDECKAIMGFPQDFLIPVSRTQMYRQMGNSVVVKVISSIAENLVPKVRKLIS